MPACSWVPLATAENFHHALTAVSIWRGAFWQVLQILHASIAAELQ
jgi:hypothetical protein